MGQEVDEWCESIRHLFGKEEELVLVRDVITQRPKRKGRAGYSVNRFRVSDIRTRIARTSGTS